jgi:hypothetical protein
MAAASLCRHLPPQLLRIASSSSSVAEDAAIATAQVLAAAAEKAAVAGEKAAVLAATAAAGVAPSGGSIIADTNQRYNTFSLHKYNDEFAGQALLLIVCGAWRRGALGDDGVRLFCFRFGDMANSWSQPLICRHAHLPPAEHPDIVLTRGVGPDFLAAFNTGKNRAAVSTAAARSRRQQPNRAAGPLLCCDSVNPSSWPCHSEVSTFTLFQRFGCFCRV